jgi:hypothetical protein
VGLQALNEAEHETDKLRGGNSIEMNSRGQSSAASAVW